MKWTKKEADALNDLISGFGRIKSLDHESKEKLIDYVIKFYRVAYDIDDRPEPRGMVV